MYINFFLSISYSKANYVEEDESSEILKCCTHIAGELPRVTVSIILGAEVTLHPEKWGSNGLSTQHTLDRMGSYNGVSSLLAGSIEARGKLQDE